MRRAATNNNNNAPKSSGGGGEEIMGLDIMMADGDGGDAAAPPRCAAAAGTKGKIKKRRAAGPKSANRKIRNNQSSTGGGGGGGSGGSSSSSSNGNTTTLLIWMFVAFMGLLLMADFWYLRSLSSSSQPLEETHAENVTIHPALLEQLPPKAGDEEEEEDPQRKQNQQPPPQQHDGKSNNSIYNDKERIFEILRQANVDPLQDLDAETIAQLPTWSDVVRLFGPEPQIIGLEGCDAFRESTDPTIRFFGIAGTFNTGTNLLSELMIQNCQITERMMVHGNQSKGMRWQVPWGKHYPATRRGMHTTTSDWEVPYTNSLPLLTIRDPYDWAQSMCRHTYTANWHHDPKKHCPNIVPNEVDMAKFPKLLKNKTYVPVSVKYAEDFVTHHESLPHFYNDWYHLYWNVTYPRIIVRFEDLLFHGQQVTETLCACGGGVPREDRHSPVGFQHISESAKLGTKAHGKSKTNLVGALIKYGNHVHRIDQMTAEDLAAAKKILDPVIMEAFNYHHPNE